MLKMVIRTVAGMVIAGSLALLPAVAAEQGAGEAVIAVKGMMCSSCSKHVEEALRKLDGVAEVSVDLKHDRVKVIYDKGKTTPPALAEAIRKAGYQAEPQSSQ